MRYRGHKLIDAGGVFTEKVNVGTKIWFTGEKQGYTVRASNRLYSVCTKPFNPQKTVLYTVIDWVNRVRGVEGLIFSRGAETTEECEEMLARLTNAETDISQRNWCELSIEKVELKLK